MDRNALTKLSYGLYLITTKYEKIFAGCIVNTVVQATPEEKPKLLVIVHKDNYTNKIMKKSKKVNISVLNQEADMLLIGKFGFRTSENFNKLENTQYVMGQNQIPIVTQYVSAYIEANIIQEMDCSTHTIFMLEAQKSEIINDKPVLTYEYYHNVIKGKTPPKASSYRI